MMSNFKDLVKGKMIGGTHWLMWNHLNEKYNNILVSEYPKSGATWFCKMLSDASGVFYPQNEPLPKFRSSILHGVHFYDPKFGKVIFVVRDGRDVMVSAYYYFLFKNEKNAQFAVDRFRGFNKFKDYDDIERNLPSFIEYMFTRYTMRNVKISWNALAKSHLNNDNIHIVKYEDLLTDAADELKGALKFLDISERSEDDLKKIVEKYSFKNLSNRARGEEKSNSFYRKGIAGDWKNKFSLEASKVFDEFAGDTLIELGYEKDHNWY